jgi:hypothetical protein
VWGGVIIIFIAIERIYHRRLPSTIEVSKTVYCSVLFVDSWLLVFFGFGLVRRRGTYISSLHA